MPLNKNNGVFDPCLADGYTDVKDHKFDDSKQYWYNKATGNVVSDQEIAAMTAEQRKVYAANLSQLLGQTGGILSGQNKMQVFVFGNDEQILLCSRLDNLGKGASGAAVQCLNIMMGIDETTGLV